MSDLHGVFMCITAHYHQGQVLISHVSDEHMKLHILNDLHIEFEDFAPSATDADVVVLAGDIGVGMGGLRWARDRFPDRPVIYVPGNHEFYHQDIALIDEMKAQLPDHIHVLNDDQVIIDGVRFLGSILWTDFALFGEADKFFAIQQARQHMTDFSIIQNGSHRFTPEDAIRLQTASRDWLAAKLAMALGDKGYYRLSQIQLRHFYQTGQKAGLHEQDMESIFSGLAGRMEGAISGAAALAADAAMPESTSGPMLAGVSKRAGMINVCKWRQAMKANRIAGLLRFSTN